MLKIKVDFELKSTSFVRRLDGKVEGRYFNLLGVGAEKSPPFPRPPSLFTRVQGTPRADPATTNNKTNDK